MAIEKMVLLKIMGSLDNINPILRELIFCENAHLNLNVENSSAYNDYLAVHQYESEIIGLPMQSKVNPENIHTSCSNCLSRAEELSEGLGLKLKLDKEFLKENNYSLEQAKNDLDLIQSSIGDRVEEINLKKQQINELVELREKIDGIIDKNVDFRKVANFNYFDYELGTFSYENKSRLKKNYQTLSAIILKVGNLKDSSEDLYMIIYPKQYKEETDNLLKSLNWNKFEIPEEYIGSPADNIIQIDSKITNLQKDIDGLNSSIEDVKKKNETTLLKVYNVFKLEDKIAELEQKAVFGNNAFAVDVWVKETDKAVIEKAISSVTDNYSIITKNTDDFGDVIVVPTKLKNNWFSKPFEMIVNMYGLPAYDEIDPTPFVAISFCLAFGIMFGDIGQGLIYVLAGLFLKKKMEAAGGLAIRLGASSMVFGCIYGSLFGLEREQYPWIPGLLHGSPLNPDNIPMILVAGVVFGILALTASYALGITNSLRNGNIEEGVFGKNGIVGYIFFISFIFTIIALTGIFNIPMILPLTTLLITLVILVLKQPITSLVTGHRPLFHEKPSEYLTESIFEAVETILGTLSNSISFVRVGAFALNHAGLFLAFLVISEMMPNIILKLFVIILGNILILSLEGLVVLIQSLRLHYYEMFGKYFKGSGVAFKPIKLS